MDWNKTYAAIYRARKDYLKPIFEIDPYHFKRFSRYGKSKKSTL